MGKITLNYEQIVEASNRLNSTSTKMNNTFQEVQNIINATIPDVWDGNAAQEYKAGLDKIVKKFPDFVNAVKNEQQILDNAKSNYGSVDTAVKNASL